MTQAQLKAALRDRGTDLRVRADGHDWIVSATCPLAPFSITIVGPEQDVAIERALEAVDVHIARHYEKCVAQDNWN